MFKPKPRIDRRPKHVGRPCPPSSTEQQLWRTAA